MLPGEWPGVGTTSIPLASTWRAVEQDVGRRELTDVVGLCRRRVEPGTEPGRDLLQHRARLVAVTEVLVRHPAAASMASNSSSVPGA